MDLRPILIFTLRDKWFYIFAIYSLEYFVLSSILSIEYIKHSFPVVTNIYCSLVLSARRKQCVHVSQDKKTDEISDLFLIVLHNKHWKKMFKELSGMKLNTCMSMDAIYVYLNLATDRILPTKNNDSIKVGHCGNGDSYFYSFQNRNVMQLCSSRFDSTRKLKLTGCSSSFSQTFVIRHFLALFKYSHNPLNLLVLVLVLYLTSLIKVK